MVSIRFIISLSYVFWKIIIILNTKVIFNIDICIKTKQKQTENQLYFLLSFLV